MISATEMLGGLGHAPRENFAMIDGIWYVLMYYLIRFSLKKVPFVITKILGSLLGPLSYMAILLLCVILLPEKFFYNRL